MYVLENHVNFGQIKAKQVLFGKCRLVSLVLKIPSPDDAQRNKKKDFLFFIKLFLIMTSLLRGKNCIALWRRGLSLGSPFLLAALKCIDVLP